MIKDFPSIDENGFFRGMSPCQPKAHKPSEWALPDDCIDEEPPVGELSDGKRWRWDSSNKEWIEGDPAPEATIKELTGQDPPDPIDWSKVEPMLKLRGDRLEKLSECDWEITRGLERGDDITDLKKYRQDLRDLPNKVVSGDLPTPELDVKTGEITNITFPTKP
tara:strand:+ start:938 stop:1429 length:492 start_codon:yes stop_codon:yes gene_type:complete